MIIPLGCTSPRTSSDLPESGAGLTFGFLFGLAPGGVYPAVRVTTNAVRSYRTFSPLPTRHPKMSVGGIFSVALSVDSRRPDVIWHPALWSPGLSSILHRWPTRTMTTETAPRSPSRLPPCQHRPTGKRRQVGYSSLIAFELLQHQAIEIVLSTTSDAGCNHTGNTRR